MAAVAVLVPGATALGGDGHAIAMHGEPLYPAGFTHFAYADPDAPKGGRIVLGQLGSFDSLNPFILRGNAVGAVRTHTYESLLARSWDEPFTLYGQIADSVETDPERTWVSFHINPAARFSDGMPVTVDDVVFSLNLLRDHGRPNHQTYYTKITRIERPAPGTVRFRFPEADDRELPLILGLMPILPRHAVDPATFERGGLALPIGSGPYRVENVDAGRSVTFQRDPDWWGRDLPANRGRFNFDTVRIDYYRDTSALFEAFRAGQVDMRTELDASRWAGGYDFPAMQDGTLVRAAIPHGRPSGLYGFAFNTRRAIFRDVRVRKALALLFDFDWVNANLLDGAFTRTLSLFDNTTLAARGPASLAERALLAPFIRDLDPQIMAEGLAFPPTANRTDMRAVLKTALDLLEQAGWRVAEGRLVNRAGLPLQFEVLLGDPSAERLALAWADTLARAGIDVAVRTADSSQYEGRRRAFDFDVTLNRWAVSLSPGNEQAFYWSSEAAETEGSRNYPGVRSPAVDAMIAALLAARDRAAFTTAARALDRALMSGWYVVPLYHQPTDWIARAAWIGMPGRQSLYGAQVDTWWDSRLK